MRKRIFLSLVSVFILTHSQLLSQNYNIDLLSTMYSRWGGIVDIDVQGNYAYLATQTSGFSIVDISNPVSPVQVSSLIFEDAYCGEVEVSDDVACVYAYGLKIIDISSPYSPTELADFNEPFSSRFIINGSYVYGFSNTEGLQVLNISNPEFPFIETVVDSFVYLFKGVVQDDILYMTDNNFGIRIYDISNPVSPFQIGIYETGDGAYDIAVDGNYIYYSDGETLHILNVLDPANPYEVSSFSHSLIGQYFVYADGLISFTGMYLGMLFLNVENPNNIYVEGIFDEFPIYCAEPTGDLLYVSHNDPAALYVLNIANPAQPQIIGELFNPPGFCDMVAANGIVYIADDYYGVTIIDASNPNAPQQISQIPAQYRTWTIDKVGNYIYYNGSGLDIADVSDPGNPLLLSTSPYGFSILKAEDTLVYTHNYMDGFAIFDVSDPTSPVMVGNLPNPLPPPFFECNDMEIRDGFIYSVFLCGLIVCNVQNPYDPQLVSFEYGTLPGFSIELKDNLALISTGLYITVADISNPYNVFEVMQIPNIKGVIKIDGDYLYSARSEGLYIYNISDLSAIDTVGYYDTRVGGCNYDVSGPYLYLGDVFFFEIYDCSDALSVDNSQQNQPPHIFSLQPCYPNPFNSTTTIPFTIDRALPVKLVVYNQLGQEVATLIDDRMQAGNYLVNWDAKQFSSGVYLISLESPKIKQTQKVILLK